MSCNEIYVDGNNILDALYGVIKGLAILVILNLSQPLELAGLI